MKIENKFINKVGKIEIDVNDLKTLPPKILKLIFSNFFPFNIEHRHDFCRYTSIYTGMSEMFDNIKEGEVIPFYVLSVNLEENSISFEKVKP